MPPSPPTPRLPLPPTPSADACIHFWPVQIRQYGPVACGLNVATTCDLVASGTLDMVNRRFWRCIYRCPRAFCWRCRRLTRTCVATRDAAARHGCDALRSARHLRRGRRADRATTYILMVAFRWTGRLLFCLLTCDGDAMNGVVAEYDSATININCQTGFIFTMCGGVSWAVRV